MNKTEKQFKKDFESKIEKQDINLTFDTKQLAPNAFKPKKPFPWKVVIPLGCSAVALAITVGFGALVFNAFFKIESSVSTKRMKLSMNEISIAKSNTFKPLNNVTYPDGTQPTKGEIFDSESSAYNNFTDLTYKSLVKTSKKENMTYSPIGLYSVLNEMYGSISRTDLAERFDALLGLNETQRVNFYKKVMLANSFSDEKSTIQLKNAAFFTSDYNYSSSYVDKLTQLYVMAYTCDFGNSKDVKKMVEWVNEAVHSNGFVDEKWLEVSDDSLLYWFSTLYFKNAWANKYLNSENTKDVFHLANGLTKETTYMNHSYLSEYYYDYDTYISFKDYYYGGNASVTYIIPKTTDVNIYELTKDANIFEEKEENKVFTYEPGEEGFTNPYFEVRLSTPKFKNSVAFNFNSTMADLGFGDMFIPDIDSFHSAFNDSRLNDVPVYLDILKQKNEVEFNEDGSIIKSITTGMAKAGDSMFRTDHVLEVKLNQPFIYIIRDINDAPIFVGHIDNPIYE